MQEFFGFDDLDSRLGAVLAGGGIAFGGEGPDVGIPINCPGADFMSQLHKLIRRLARAHHKP
jgi:hypothetical protein